VYLWVEYSMNKDEWLTELVLSHSDPESPHYRSLDSKEYVSFNHDVSGPGHASPPSPQKERI
jgi:hypothetical protein